MASLFTLSNELTILIIEHLDRIRPPAPPARPNEDPAHILPTANSTLVNLSCVNRLLRDLVAPFLFRTLILHNTRKSGNCIALIADSAYARHVKKVEFVGSVLMSPDGITGVSGQDEIDYVPKEDDLPAVVAGVLSSLSKFPKLESVGIECVFEEDSYEDGFYHFEDSEDEQQIADAEQQQGWRALMNDIYSALIRNPPGTIKGLELRNVVAKQCSTWHTPAWHSLLSGLSSFKISFRDADNGAGWCLSTQPGYRDFVGSTHQWLWDHLSNVKNLSIAAKAGGPVGIDGLNIAALSMSGSHFKALETLRLDYVFAGTIVEDLLTVHSATLISVKMQNTFASRRTINNQMCWSDFFGELSRAKPLFPKLVEFGVVSERPGWEVDADEQEARGLTVEEARVAVEKRRKAQDEMGVGLTYAWMDDKYGFIRTDFDDEDEEIEAQEKIDRAAYAEFMSIIDENRRRLGAR